MNSIFREDISQQETSFFLKNTYLLPIYLKEQKYSMLSNDIKKIIDDVKETSSVQPATGHLSLSDSLVTENFMKRCFSKCKQFVLEDWVDYDELDCTMRCTLLHKKSFNLLKDVSKNI
jgi:hypothetical protein